MIITKSTLKPAFICSERRSLITCTYLISCSVSIKLYSISTHYSPNWMSNIIKEFILRGISTILGHIDKSSIRNSGYYIIIYENVCAFILWPIVSTNSYTSSFVYQLIRFHCNYHYSFFNVSYYWIFYCYILSYLNVYSNLNLSKQDQIWNINILCIVYLYTPCSTIMNWWICNWAICSWVSVKSKRWSKCVILGTVVDFYAIHYCDSIICIHIRINSTACNHLCSPSI